MTDRRLAVRTLLVNVLDAAITLYALLLVGVVVAGGFDLGFISATSTAKPALWLMVLVPIRLSVGGDSWVVRRAASAGRHARAAVEHLHVPAAVRDVAFAIVITRGAAVAIAFAANILLTPDRERPFTVPLPWAKLAETFAVWDSGWYFDIASRGYFFDTGGQSSIAFFPLYPLLVRSVGAVFGGSAAALWASAIAVSWAAFIGALVVLHRLTCEMTGSREAARRTVLYVAVFPFSFYFTRVYTEAVFLLLTVLAVQAAQYTRWGRAGIFAALATVTRPNGILIAVPLILMAVADRPAWPRVARRGLALAWIPFALVAFSGYVYTVAGDPLAWLDAQRHWGYSLGHPPYRHILSSLSAMEDQGLYAWLLRSETTPFDFVYTVVSLLFLALVPAVIRRFGVAFGMYVLVSMLVPLSGNALVGIGRYASVLFPVFMLAGTSASPRMHEAIVVVSALFHAFFLALFVAWFPLH